MNGFDERMEGAHQKMVRLVGKGKLVLEIGCGKGFVSEQLRKNGCAVTGIEIDKESAKKAKRFCKSVLVGNVEEMKLDFVKESFDVILFGDVLEHLLDPKAVLKKLRPFLVREGKIVVSLPNVANWKIRLGFLVGKFGYTEWGILDKTHVRFFTMKSARDLLKEAGFRVVEEDFVPSFPLPFLKAFFAKIRPSVFAFQFVFVAKKALWAKSKPLK